MPFVPDAGGSVGSWAATVGKAVSAMDSKAVAATKAETQKLLDAANGGGFRISPDAMKPIQDALADMQDRLSQMGFDVLQKLGQAPKLGSHDYGQQVAQHDRRGGGLGDGSATVVVDQLRDVLEIAGKALEKAKQNYEEHEAETAGGLNSAQV